MWGELQTLLARGIDAGDLQRAQRLFESRWLRRLETMEGQANFLAEWEALGDWRWADEYAARMLAAAPAEVTEAARRYLDPAEASMMVYRPESAPEFASGVVAAFASLDNAPASTLESVTLPPAPPAPSMVTGTAPERTHGHVTVFRTARGVPILVRHKEGTPIVHLGLYSLGGALDEAPEHAGIATLLSRTTLKGTARRTTDIIALETELLGGTIAPTVTSDGLGWTLSVTNKHLAAGIDLLADVVLSPSMPSAAFETERSVALSQLAVKVLQPQRLSPTGMGCKLANCRKKVAVFADFQLQPCCFDRSLELLEYPPITRRSHHHALWF